MTTLVALPANQCPSCGSGLLTNTLDQPALFLHGGYGATRRTRAQTCPRCGWTLCTEIADIHPYRETEVR